MTNEATTTAKISRPHPYGAYPRERLFQRLDESRQRRLVWICGPPGSGKTHLVASYVDARSLPAVWYQIDPGDRDPATFIFFLREAIVQLQASCIRLPLLTPEYFRDLSGFFRRWFRELVSLFPSPLIVIDDFHEVENAPELQQLVVDAVEAMPGGGNLIVISRSEPPARLAKLQASEQVAMVEWSDLRLTLDDALGIASESGVLPDDEARTLYEQCDGWAAGFTLLREYWLRTGLVGLSAVGQVMPTIFAYFATQIFEHVPPQRQEVLLSTSFLPQMTAAMAESISGIAGAGDLLEWLHRRHLFTERRESTGVTYQYHALFRAFLRDQARQTYTAARRAALLCLAGELLESAGNPEAAVPLYMEADDRSKASALILRIAPDMVATGRGQTLRQWVADLSQTERKPSPWLDYWVGSSLVSIDLKKARQALEGAFETFRAAADRTGQIMATAMVLEIYCLELDDFNPARRWVSIFEQLAEDMPNFPSCAAEARVFGGVVGFMFWGIPGHPMLYACAMRAHELLRGDLEANQKIIAASYLIEYFGHGGYPDEARRLIALIAPELGKPNITPLVRASWLIRSSWYWFTVAAYDEIERSLREAHSIAVENGFHFLMTLIYGNLADSALERGDLRSAGSIIESHRTVLPQSRRLSVGRYHTLSAKLALAEGCPEAALDHARKAFAAAESGGMLQVKNSWGVTLACALTACGRADDALALLGTLEDTFPADRYPYTGCRVPLARAVALAARGKDDEAGRILERWLSELNRRGFLSFGRIAELVVPVCELALRLGIEAEFARTLIRKHNAFPRSPDIPGWPWPIEIRTLGAFEVLVEGQPLQSHGKEQHRPLELLQAIVAFGGHRVSSATVSAALWPDAMGDAAETALRVTLLRLRKLLRRDEAVTSQAGRIGLNSKLCRVDVWELEAQFDRTDGALDQADPDLAAIGERLRKLYPGPFLASEGDSPWMLPTRDRLGSRFLRIAATLGNRLESVGDLERAIVLYQRVLEQDNLSESTYRRLMKCHAQLGHRAEALSAYRRCRDMLSIILGVKPAPDTERLYRDLLGDAKGQ